MSPPVLVITLNSVSVLNLKGDEQIWSLGTKRNGVTHFIVFFSRAYQREILFLMLWSLGT